MTVQFAIIGPGKLGTALAKLLVDAGHVLVGVVGRSLESAQRACAFAGQGTATAEPAEVTPGADVILVTTPDCAIRQVACELAASNAVTPHAVVAHCSGALPSSVLSPVRECEAEIGSMHPCQTIASAEEGVRALPGSHFCVEGDVEAVACLEELVRALRGHVVRIPTEAKPLYHAAACVASNYMVALEYCARDLAAAAGLNEEDSLRCLVPLLRATVENLAKLGPPAALTGPIERGDVDTVARHLRAIGAAAPRWLALYRMLGRLTVELAIEKGSITEPVADDLRRLLD